MVDLRHAELIRVFRLKHDENTVVCRTDVIPKGFIRVVRKNNVPTFGTFDCARVRDYIKTGKGSSPARLFIHKKFLNSVQLGPHQHALILAGRNDKHRVDAIVRLFGGLSYFVTLSDEYQGVDFVHTIVCDAQRGELNGMLFSVVEAELLQTEDVATSNDTVWDSLELSGKWFVDFLDASIRSYLVQKQKAAKAQEVHGS